MDFSGMLTVPVLSNAWPLEDKVRCTSLFTIS